MSCCFRRSTLESPRQFDLKIADVCIAGVKTIGRLGLLPGLLGCVLANKVIRGHGVGRSNLLGRPCFKFFSTRIWRLCPQFRDIGASARPSGLHQCLRTESRIGLLLQRASVLQG
jgi:hypothetical protein